MSDLDLNLNCKTVGDQYYTCKQLILKKYKEKLRSKITPTVIPLIIHKNSVVKLTNITDRTKIRSHTVSFKRSTTDQLSNKENSFEFRNVSKKLPKFKIEIGEVKNSFYSKLNQLEQKLDVNQQRASIPLGFFSPVQENRDLL